MDHLSEYWKQQHVAMIDWPKTESPINGETKYEMNMMCSVFFVFRFSD